MLPYPTRTRFVLEGFHALALTCLLDNNHTLIYLVVGDGRVTRFGELGLGLGGE